MANNLYEYYQGKGQGLPSVADRTTIATQAGISNYTGTAEQNTSLLGYLQNTPSQGNTTITPEKVSPESPLVTKETPTSTSNIDTNLTVKALADKTNKDIIQEQADLKTQTDALTKDITAQGEIDKEAIYKAQGVDVKKKQVDTLTSDIEKEQQAVIERVKLLKENPEGLSQTALNSEISRIQNESAMTVAQKGIALSAINRDYENSYNIATRQITDKTDALKYAIEAKKFVLEQLGTKLATDKANAFTLQIKSLDNESSMMKDAIKTATDGMNSGTIDQTTGTKAIQDLISGKTSLSDYYASLGVDTGKNTTGKDISGYDITSYATDPTHEQKVLSIYDTITDITDAKTAQNVISDLSPNSPVTGSMIMKSSDKYGVDPKLMIALMQQDSSLGTAGLGAKTNNPGNVGNDDAGNKVNFKTVDEGVDAVAKWLSKHKVAEPVSYAQYGLLANTSFDPNNSVDKSAEAYLNYYMKNATFPTSYALGMGRSDKATAKFNNASARANDLYFEATGNSLPDVNVLKGNKALIVANNKILNNQAILSDTIEKNFNLAIEGEITNNVNKNATIVNKILNPVYLALGDPATAQALVSNGTITQEFANLISIRNASGTTVADKYMADELIQFGTSVEAQKGIVERLKAEAMNIHSALQDQNKKLYQTIDPLQQSPENPNRNVVDEKASKYFTELGMTDMGNNTLGIPRTQWTKLVNAHDTSTGLSQGDALIKLLKSKGYELKVN